MFTWDDLPPVSGIAKLCRFSRKTRRNPLCMVLFKNHTDNIKSYKIFDHKKNGGFRKLQIIQTKKHIRPIKSVYGPWWLGIPHDDQGTGNSRSPSMRSKAAKTSHVSCASLVGGPCSMVIRPGVHCSMYKWRYKDSIAFHTPVIYGISPIMYGSYCGWLRNPVGKWFIPI